MAMSDQTRAIRAVRRGTRLDRLIPGFLLDSPVSHAGYWFGTAVGWVWGGIWSTGPIRKRGNLWVFTGMPDWAYGRGGVCVGGCFLTGDATVTHRLIAHESVHARQWRRYGLLLPFLYTVAGRNPRRNRFEIMAGLADGNYVGERFEDALGEG